MPVKSSLIQSRYYIAALFFLFFLGFYLLTARGALYIADSMVNFQTTRSIVENKSLEVSCQILDVFVDQGPTGACYSKYDLGLPIASIPLYYWGRLFAGPDPNDLEVLSAPKFWVSTFSQIITAATCAVLYLLGLFICRSNTYAVSLAFLFGIASIAWPYAGIYISQPFVGFLLLTAVYLLAAYKATSTRALLGAGLVLGWAVLTRIDSIPLVAIVILYGMVKFYQQGLGWKQIIIRCIWLGTPVVAAVFVYLSQSYLRTGSWFQVGYADEGWDIPFYVGLYGLLFSLGKGIIFYSPLSLLAAIGWVKLWQRGWKAETILVAALTGVQLATYASWWAWEGGEIWGPRFLVSTHALLLVGLLPWIDETLPRTPLLIVIGVSFLVQIIGTTTELSSYLKHTSFTYEQTLYTWQASPIIGQFFGLLRREYFFLVANRAAGFLTLMETVLWVVICLILMAMSAFLLRRAIAQDDKSVA